MNGGSDQPDSFLECIVLGLLAQPKAINPIHFGRKYFEVMDSDKAITPILFGMYCFGVVNTAKSDYPSPFWNVLFWGCLHSQRRSPRCVLACFVLMLLAQPAATTSIFFGTYCFGVVSRTASTGHGD